MSYNKIKSEFVKKELTKTTWKDSEYIDELMKIERFALGGTFGMVTPYLWNQLIKKYPKQWNIIYLELNPRGYKKLVAWEKGEAGRERKEEERRKKKEEAELIKEKTLWVKMGGRK